MTDLLGPASATNSVTTRPADTRTFGVTDTWFKPCSTPAAQDGTQLQAVFFNGLLAQFRDLIRGNGLKLDGVTPVITENDALDTLALSAVLQLIQRCQANYGVDTGSSDAMVVAPTTVFAEYKPGMRLLVVKNPNVGANATPTPTIAVSGLPPLTIVKCDASSLGAGDLKKGGIFEVEFDGTYARLVSLVTLSDVLALLSANGVFHFGQAGGSANAVTVASVTPSVSGYTAGYAYEIFMPAAAASGGTTVQIGALAARAVSRQDGTPIQANDWGANEPVILLDDGSQLRLYGVRTAFLPSSAIQVFATPGTTNWTVPNGVYRVKRVRVWGAGGGSGGAYNGGMASGAGGGGYAEGTFAVTPGQVIPVTVGAGGSAGTGAPTNGGNGGTSAFGSMAYAAGGAGSIGQNATTDPTSYNGGMASGGQFNLTGGYSGGGYTAGTNVIGGSGGGSFGTSSTPAGKSATAYYPGGGAGGAACASGTSNSAAGAVGANGLVVIEY